MLTEDSTFFFLSKFCVFIETTEVFMIESSSKRKRQDQFQVVQFLIKFKLYTIQCCNQLRKESKEDSGPNNGEKSTLRWKLRRFEPVHFETRVPNRNHYAMDTTVTTKLNCSSYIPPVQKTVERYFRKLFL